METITVDLGEGDSAELYKELRHGTSRKVQEIYRPYLAKPEVKQALEAKTETDEEKLNKLFEIIGPTVDVTGAADVLIIGQVAKWTFGPVTQEVLDGIAERKREALVQEANKLYGEVPLLLGGAGN